MANRFNVVAVRVQHKSSVVVWMVLRPIPRCAIILCAGSQRSLMESHHFCVRLGTKGKMHTRGLRHALGKPEVTTRIGAWTRIAQGAEAYRYVSDTVRDRITQGSQHGFIKSQ